MKRLDSPPQWLMVMIVLTMGGLNIGVLLFLWNIGESLMRAQIVHAGWILSVWMYSLLLCLFTWQYEGEQLRTTFFILIGTGIASVLLPIWLPSLHYITQVRAGLASPLLGPREIIYKGWGSQLFFAFMLLVALHGVYYAEKLYRSRHHKPHFRWTLFALIGTLCFWMLLDSLALMWRYLNVDALLIAFTPSLATNLLLVYHTLKGKEVVTDTPTASSTKAIRGEPPFQISRTTLYKSYTLLVFSIFLLLLGFMGEIIRLIGTHLNFFLAFLTAFFLLLLSLIVLLFRSVKERVQRFIAKNFYKSLYDYRAEWERANQRILPIQDARTLHQELLHAVAEPIGAEGGCLLTPNSMDGFVVPASYGQFANLSGQIKTSLIESLSHTEVFDWIWRYGKPILLKQMTHPGVHLASLKENGICIIVPIIFERQLMGLILLTRAAREYTQEDVDFLETIGGQISLALANQRFRESLIEAEEIKNFNRLSAFVLHDLKNAASMLSMLIQNVDKNLDNPEFRVDMIQTMKGVVERIQKLIRRLSTSPQTGETLEFQRTNLKELIQNTIKTTRVDQLPSIRFQAELGEVPSTLVAPLEIQKVLHNLLINAVEAIQDTGEIHVKLDQYGTHICVTVKDTGCGISQEYIENDLFKPFRTSKETGLGIGLYQCRTIVEAHQGRIEVESEQGSGSEFRVLLPLK